MLQKISELHDIGLEVKLLLPPTLLVTSYYKPRNLARISRPELEVVTNRFETLVTLKRPGSTLMPEAKLKKKNATPPPPPRKWP
jgi:hypothetical protein